MSLNPRLVRLALALAMLAFPLVYGWRILASDPVPMPLPEPPTEIDLIVLTTGEWPTPERIPETPVLDGVRSRGIVAGPVFAGSDDAAASAVTLWTGRVVANHGVRDRDRSLPPLTWSLAQEAADSGARTGAFLSQPFCRRQGIRGFDQVIEAPEMPPAKLGELAAAFLEREPGRRHVVWIHLDSPGPEGIAIEAALGPVLASQDRRGRRTDTLTVVTSLSGREAGWMEGSARVPLIIELPTAMNARRVTAAHLSHVHVTALLRRLMRLGGPNAALAEAPLQAEADPLWNATRGAGAFEPVWVEGEFGHVYRRSGLRVQVDPVEPGAIPSYDMRALAGAQMLGKNAPTLPANQIDAARQVYLDARAEYLRGAVEPVTAPAD